MAATTSRSKTSSPTICPTKERLLAPSIPRVVEAMRRIGHSPEEAILDIADNSVQNQASSVQIFLSGQKNFDRLEIADNGKGMAEEALTEAMRLGSLVNYEPNSLSKYGIGLKAAALSQGRRLTVLTRATGHPLLKAVLDIDVIQARNEYIIIFDDPSSEEVESFEERTAGIGTVVVVDKVDADSAKQLMATINRTRRAIGETYHRFMTAADPVAFGVNGTIVDAFDPLFIGDPQVEELLEPQSLEFTDAVGNTVVVKVRATQLPHPPTQENRKEAKGTYDIKANNIGFYVYRANRIIRRADAFDLFTRDTKLLAFRGSVDFDTDADDFFSLNVAKHKIVVSENVRGKLEEVFRPVLNHSRKIWVEATRTKGAESEEAAPKVHKPASSQINAKEPLLSTGRKERTTPQEKAQKASVKIPRETQPPRDKRRIIEVDELVDGLLWEPSLDKNGQVYVRINKNHPFYEKVYQAHGQDNPDIVEAVDYLLWGLAHAEYNIGYDEDEKIEMMENLRRFASSNIRRLLAE